MKTLRQIIELCRLSLLSLPQRAGSVGVIVVGIAGVVGVLVSLLAMRDGFQATLGATGRLDEAIVLRGGANAELSSRLTREDLTVITEAMRLPARFADAAAMQAGLATAPRETLNFHLSPG